MLRSELSDEHLEPASALHLAEMDDGLATCASRLDVVAEAIRAASLGEASSSDSSLLTALGLSVDGQLTDAALRFEDAYWVYGEIDDSVAIWKAALLSLPATQALIQGLHGRGSVAFLGAHHLLARHRFAGSSEMASTRAFLQTLNAAGIVAYSNKHQTVRILAPVPDQVAAVVRVIEPERPYSNVVALREILRSCEGYIHWAEPHLPWKVLEPLSYEADSSTISDIKLLSSETSDNERTRSDFGRFAQEMSFRGIAAEWRVIEKKKMKWHDRFIVGRRQAWNVPR